MLCDLRVSELMMCLDQLDLIPCPDFIGGNTCVLKQSRKYTPSYNLLKNQANMEVPKPAVSQMAT